jgi:hypothetical protein
LTALCVRTWRLARFNCMACKFINTHLRILLFSVIVSGHVHRKGALGHLRYFWCAQ